MGFNFIGLLNKSKNAGFLFSAVIFVTSKTLPKKIFD